MKKYILTLVVASFLTGPVFAFNSFHNHHDHGGGSCPHPHPKPTKTPKN